MTKDYPYPKAMADFKRLRQSLLGAYDSCGLSSSFGLKYSKGWATPAQARGIIFHRFAAQALMALAQEKEETMPTDVALAILIECMRQADQPVEEVVTIPSHEIADLRWIVMKWVKDNVWSTKNLVGVEVPLTAILQYPDPRGGFVDRELSGRLDALFVEGIDNEQATVVDWKTGWGLPPASKISAEGFHQQRFYAWLLMCNYPSIQEVTLREFYVRHSEPREASIMRTQLDEIEGHLSGLAERFDRSYETDTWPVQPAAHCAYCPRPTACPIFPTARQAGAISSQEEAERRAGEVTVAKAVAKQLDAALKAWSNSHGPITLNSGKSPKVLGFRPTTRVKRPEREELEAALRSSTRPNLDALYTTEATTRFEQHTPSEAKPDEDADKKLADALQGAIDYARKRRP